MFPERFTERMKYLLGDEFCDFDKALSEPSVHGVRVNRLKTDKQTLVSLFDGELSELCYVDGGFIPTKQTGLGQMPAHHAGMFYSQDPGAMSAVAALELKDGDRVLDVCAAPGGKTTQILNAIGNSGVLLSNEFVPKRAKILVGNLERMGAKNAVVTSLDTAELPKMFEAYFDAVVCDAPCSGEGMFRKCDEAIEDWSEENVIACARRQSEILNNCASTVKPGGKLLYSTCTYSIDENEGVVEQFLLSHPDFYLERLPDSLYGVCARGILPTDASPDSLRLTARFYPHKSKGEGQFIALLKRKENPDILSTIIYKEREIAPTKQESVIITDFLKSNFKTPPKGRIVRSGEGFALVCHDLPIPDKSVFMRGVMLGEIRGKLLLPHHHLFSAFGGEMRLVENLTRDDVRVEKYLRGEEIPTTKSDSGYCAVLYEGAAIGGGKMSSGRIKNHYPKGLRKP